MSKRSNIRHMTAIYFCFATLTICNGASFFSDLFEDTHDVVVDNMTHSQLHGALYYVSLYGDVATRASDVWALPSGTVRNITAPPRRLGSSRKLFVSDDISNLSPEFVARKKHISDYFTSTDLGSKEGFKIIEDQGRLHITTTDQHSSHLTTLRERRAYEEMHPHTNETAQVSQYLGRPSHAESEYMAKRRTTMTRILSELTGEKLTAQDTPRISLGGSSGGMRAFLTTVGVLRGVEKLGIPLEYTSGVSGGSWAIMFWLAEKAGITTFSERLKGRLEKMPRIIDVISMSDKDISAVREISRAYRKKIFRLYKHRTHHLLTLYASFISYYLVRPVTENHQNLTLSQLQAALDPEHYPLPIANAVTPHHRSNKHYHWLEFTPYDIRLVGGGYTIPTWSFLRRFRNGSSVNRLPEPFLGYFTAFWGSFFSASIEDFLTKSPIAKHTASLGEAISSTGKWEPQGTTSYNKKRLAASIPNFVYQLDGAPHDLAEKDYIKVIDGAHANSLPINTFLHAGRQQDIIILANASDGGFLDYQAMKRTRQVLKQYYPSIGIKMHPEEEADEHELDRILSKPFTYIPSNGPGIPSIIHITLHPVESFDPEYDPIDQPETVITNARYTRAQSEKLMGLCEHIVTKHKGEFMDAIRRAIAHRRQASSGLKT